MLASRRPILVWPLLFAAAMALLTPSSCTTIPAGETVSLGEPWRTWLSPRYKARVESRLQRRSAMRALRDVIPSHLPARQQRLSKPLEAAAVAAAAAATPSGTPAGSVSTVKVFIGVMTSIGSAGTDVPRYSKFDYAGRREVLRATWMGQLAGAGGSGTGTSGAHGAFHAAPSAVQYDRGLLDAQFVVGRPAAGSREAGLLAQEQGRHADFMVLDVPDCYTCLTNKTRAFLLAVAREHPNAEWVVKVDDDVALLPPRLLMAADQWAAIGADYIGCMDWAITYGDPAHRWHEPNARLLGAAYPLRAMGSVYVLSGRVVRHVVAARAGALRPSGSAEDSAVGMWMLGSNAKFFDDQRLCTVTCSNASVALYDPRTQGLPVDAIAVLYDNPGCTATPPWPLPYLSSLRLGNRSPKLAAMEAMWAGMRL